MSIAIVCTVLSGLGVWLSISAILNIISMAIKVLTQEEALTWERLRDVFFLIFPLAWFFYFRICHYWVRFNYVPYSLILPGTLFGVICIAATVGFGIVFTFPAVLLMFYILFFVIKK
ncbi:hypothetical protein [Marinomonas transparens]|uniref:hypothetical protein n=1 Tax=Marinomonas transparens TaxID=2795388 RepID=UPI0018F1BC51|nr:hypothetical protein [Marinomonas transparens]